MYVYVGVCVCYSDINVFKLLDPQSFARFNLFAFELGAAAMGAAKCPLPRCSNYAFLPDVVSKLLRCPFCGVVFCTFCHNDCLQCTCGEELKADVAKPLPPEMAVHPEDDDENDPNNADDNDNYASVTSSSVGWYPSVDAGSDGSKKYLKSFAPAGRVRFFSLPPSFPYPVSRRVFVWVDECVHARVRVWV